LAFVRALGRWTMTALMVNTVIGSGIFGLPSELTRLLGRASPVAMLIGALAMAIPILCIAEVASQFSEAGGSYLYVRTAFGRFPGIQIGWFHLLTSASGGAANAALFMAYLAAMVPWTGRGWIRATLLIVLIGIPTAANCVGVRSGARMNNFLTVSKLLPLALVIVLGFVRFSHHFVLLQPSDLTSPGLGSWVTAMLLLVYFYSGAEDVVLPTAEVKEPRRTVPFSLLAGLTVCMIVYASLQFVTVTVMGASTTDHPIADTASMLIGRSGEMFVAISAMIATYGCISGVILNLPRLASSLASNGDFPEFLAKLHPRSNTPAMAIVLFATVVYLMAATGTFLWAVVVSGGATIVIYTGVCAALIRLRRQKPHAKALRIPCGRMLAIISIVIMLALLTRLSAREFLAMGITALLATTNWWWAKGRQMKKNATRTPVLSVQ
jgi:amino acid transporter